MASYAKPAGAGLAFELSGGNPALDLVNTLDNRFHAEGPKELLRDYGDLLRLAQQAQLLSAAQLRSLSGCVSTEAAARALRAAKELRESLAAVLYAIVDRRSPPSAALQTLQRHFLDSVRHSELRWYAAGGRTGAGSVAWHRGGFESEAGLPVWLLAQSASQLLLSPELEQVRACGAATCRWLFLDTSRNHTRRWCNMKVCGNRMKARRFQARHAD
jgi:predicted RNA-binding Zn ribbon-like protein